MLLRIASAIFLWSVVSTSSNSDCHRIRTCDDFVFAKPDASDLLSRQIFSFKDETQMAAMGHSNGIIPSKYIINLIFSTTGDVLLEGSVKIEIDLIKPVNRISINAHPDLNIDYRSMGIESSACSERIDHIADETWSSSQRPCIAKVTYLRKYETAVVDLRHIHLNPDLKYVIEFPHFKRPPIFEFDPSKPDRTVSIFIWTFAHRKAREIFPCFDHLMFKARFEYCIERNPSMISISNLPVNPDKSKVTVGNFKIDCHHATAPISTASFGLALLHDGIYEKQFRNMPDSGVVIEIFYRNGSHDLATRILATAVDSVANGEKLTQFKFPLPKLTVILLPKIPLIGYESFGLMAMTVMESQESIFHSLVFTKIMHQWIGNLVTLRDWRELCVQEGLIMYLEWRLVAKTLRRSIESVVNAKKDRVGLSESYEPIGRMMMDTADDAQLRCQMRSSLFFYTLSEFYGDDADEGGVVVELLRALIAKHAYESVAIEEWDRILKEITEKKEHPLEGYLQGWFNQPGMLYLLITKSSTDCIRVRQQIVGPYASGVTSPRPIPIRVHVFDSTSNSSKPIVLTKVDQKICGTKGRGHVVDPSRHSWTRKAYTIGNYRYFLQQMLRNRDLLDRKQYTNLVHDFCWALKNDMFPLANDRAGTVTAWKEVAKIVAASTTNSKMAENRFCHCCASFLAAGGSDGIPRDLCDRKTLDECDRLKIAKIVQAFDDEGARDEL